MIDKERIEKHINFYYSQVPEDTPTGFYSRIAFREGVKWASEELKEKIEGLTISNNALKKMVSERKVGGEG